MVKLAVETGIMLSRNKLVSDEWSNRDCQEIEVASFSNRINWRRRFTRLCINKIC